MIDVNKLSRNRNLHKQNVKWSQYSHRRGSLSSKSRLRKRLLVVTLLILLRLEANTSVYFCMFSFHMWMKPAQSTNFRFCCNCCYLIWSSMPSNWLLLHPHICLFLQDAILLYVSLVQSYFGHLLLLSQNQSMFDTLAVLLWRYIDLNLLTATQSHVEIL